MDTVMMDLDGDPADRKGMQLTVRRRCGRTFTPHDATECGTCGVTVSTRCRKGLSR